ncbi:hypothetical protein FRC17_009161 [Serendipita sp. 399]|nr:hypothetical protein FRC17_009161 [Serendipita sp. 399]
MECTILDVARASIASPDIFPPVTLGQGYNALSVIDGLMGYANPMRELLKEVQDISGPSQHIGCIVSIGTGMQIPTERSRTLDNESLIRIVTNTENVHQELQRKTQDLGIYFRFNNYYGFTPNSEPSHIFQSTRAYHGDATVDTNINCIVSLFLEREQRPSGSTGHEFRRTIKDILTISGARPASKPRPSLVSNFIGRDDILSGLYTAHLDSWSDDRSQEPVISILSGLGGSGKTQIALKLASEFEKIPGSSVFFLDASSEDKLLADLTDILRANGRPMTGRNWKEAIHWISHLRCWMIIFDNVDHPKFMIQDYFPRSSPGHIIITTQNSTFGALSPQNHYEVEGLAKDNAISLLLKSSRYDYTEANVIAAAEIVAEIGYLPLAVSHAAGYIYVNRNLTTYLQLYQQNQLPLLAGSHSPSAHDHRRSVAATIQLSFKRLPQKSRELMRIMAHYQVSSISASIFHAASMHQFKRRSMSGRPQSSFLQESQTLLFLLCPNGAWSEYDFNDLIKPCLEYSLLRITEVEGGAKFYSMHILVQTWLLAQQENIKGATPECLATRLLVSAITFGEWQKNLTTMQHLMPHVRLRPSAEEVRDPGAHGDFARILHQAGDYTSALVQIDYAVVGWEAKLGPTHDQTLSCMQVKANLLDLAGRVQESLDLGLHILRMRKEIYPENHPSTLICMSAVAQAMTMCRRDREAAAMAERALVLQTQAFGKEDAETVMTMTRLGWIYDNLHQYSEALTIKEEALKISKEQLGDTHITTLKSMGAVGVTLTKLGKFDRAYDLQKEIVGIRTRMLGPDHPDTISSLGNLSSTLIDMGRKEEAITQCKKVAEASTKVFGQDHTRTLRACYCLLFAYDKFREDAEKARVLPTILDLHERVLGADHKHTRQIKKWRLGMAKA